MREGRGGGRQGRTGIMGGEGGRGGRLTGPTDSKSPLQYVAEVCGAAGNVHVLHTYILLYGVWILFIVECWCPPLLPCAPQGDDDGAGRQPGGDA